MSAREIIMLGTASQVPTRRRNHNAVFLRWDELGILFDPGEGTQRQMTLAGVAATQITHIAVTHFHGDHCLGLASIIQRLSLDRVPHTVEVVYPKSGQAYFERLRYASIYHDQAHLAPRPFGGAGEVLRFAGGHLRSAPLDHGVDCWGYRLIEDDGRRMLPDALERAGLHGMQIRDLVTHGTIELDGRTIRLDQVSVPRPGQVFAFVMDTRPCAGATALAAGADLLVCEATYLDAEAGDAHEHRHMTAKQAAELARDSGVRRLVLTHFSQRYPALEPFALEARSVHADTVVPEDLQLIEVPKRRP